MKRLVILLYLVIAMATTLYGQFRENINVSLFAGTYAAQHNTLNHGNWYGMYLEYMPIKTRGSLNIGLCALASQNSYTNQDSTFIYSGSSTNFGLGLALGKYFEYLTPTFAAYFGGSFMLKQSQDLGNGMYIIQPTLINPNLSIGEYAVQQKDNLFEASLNVNFLKQFGMRENIFPRTQVRIVFQKNLSGEIVSFWNETPIREASVWNKAAYNIDYKQSIFQAGRLDLMIEPKLWVSYYHYLGDKSNWVAFGTELALKMRGRDDFLNLYFLLKKQTGLTQPSMNSPQLVFGLNFMPVNLQKNYY